MSRSRLYCRRGALCAAVIVAIAGPASAQWTPNGAHIFFNSGNVGIGASNPLHKLHVATAANANGTRGVWGLASAVSGVTTGVYGESRSNAGRGVFGFAPSATGTTFGVFGQAASPNGRGVAGVASSGVGVNIGVYGQSNSPGGWAGYFQGRAFFSNVIGVNTPAPIYRLHVVDPVLGVAGVATSATGLANGVQGWTKSSLGFGVVGTSQALTGIAAGMGGQTDCPSGVGAYGLARSTFGTNYGVFGESYSVISGWAVYGLGDTGASGFKLFQIDHPLDPANKYLNHYCAEGPEPMLVYRGNVVLDGTGAGWAELPSYFEAINRDLTYQLTPVGAPAPLLHVAAEVAENRFQIAGGTPGLKVSWTVTGTRNDAYARAYGKPVEQDKPYELRGKYLHPTLFGRSGEAGIHRERAEAAAEAARQTTPSN